MLIIQEQFWSEQTESMPIHGSWTLIESGSYPNSNPRSEDINTTAQKAWSNGKSNARQHRKLTRRKRFRTGVQLYDDLLWKQLVNLNRLRPGHCPLNSYLNRHNIIEDPSCDCGRGIENVKHFLLLYKKIRRTKERVEEEGWGEKHETGEPARRPEISEGNVRICGENRKV